MYVVNFIYGYGSSYHVLGGAGLILYQTLVLHILFHQTGLLFLCCANGMSFVYKMTSVVWHVLLHKVLVVRNLVFERTLYWGMEMYMNYLTTWKYQGLHIIW